MKPTKEDLAAARGRVIPDLIGRDLGILFVGINPSLYSAAVGHHFARPGNRFWPALHDAQITPRRLAPHEGEQLVELGCGITNLVSRATARADELTPDEFMLGGKRLRRKVYKHRPRCVAFVGIMSYRAAFNCPRAAMGLQEDKIADARLWLLPNTSGLNAHYQPADFARLFAELHHFTDREVR